MNVNRIDSGMVLKLLKELDMALGEQGERREITIFGSGAMMAQGFLRANRHTEDVDLASPDMDMVFQTIAADVGEKFGLRMGWLNSAGVIFSRNFPSGWEKRSTLVFEGKSLKVSSLGRKDLIATKFNALCGRNKAQDMDDLLDLKPSKAEITFARKWVLAQKEPSADFRDRVEKIEGKVFEKLGHGRSK
ncbi:MAG: DUF6036 family nucleotidyltransferase [Bdellovibrionales bacterium]